MNHKATSGFTLIEIMIVVLIIGIVAAMAYPSFQKSRENSRRVLCQNNLRVIATEAELHLFEVSAEDLDDLSLEDIDHRFPDGRPSCPSGGTYSLQTDIDPIVLCDYGNGHDLY